MPVTELYAFNLICENLLAALYGVALDVTFIIAGTAATFQTCFGKNKTMKILVLNAKEVLNLFRIIFLPKARCSSARI